MSGWCVAQEQVASAPSMSMIGEYRRRHTKSARLDWDISSSELKAAWRQGRKDLFYSYGKTYIQALGEQD